MILDGLDLAGVDLSGKDLSGASLKETKFAGALNLRAATFDDLRGAILDDGRELTGVDLGDLKPMHVKFTLDEDVHVHRWRVRRDRDIGANPRHGCRSPGALATVCGARQRSRNDCRGLACCPSAPPLC